MIVLRLAIPILLLLGACKPTDDRLLPLDAGWKPTARVSAIPAAAPDRLRKLLTGLHSARGYDRIRFVTELDKMPVEQLAPAIPFLIDAIAEDIEFDPNRIFVRYGGAPASYYASGLLRKIGKPAVGPLADAVKNSKSAIVRGKSATVLGRIGDPGAVDALLGALRDQNYVVRMRAASALSRLKGTRIRKALLEALRDEEDFMVRTAIITAIWGQKHPRVTDALITQLQHDGRVPTRCAAAYDLATRQNKLVFYTLARALSSEPSPEVRASVVQGLFRSTGEFRLGLLTRAAHNEYALVRRLAVFDLSYDNEEPRAIKLVKSALKDSDPGVRRGAREGLAFIQTSIKEREESQREMRADP